MFWIYIKMNKLTFDATPINELLVPSEGSTVKMNMYWIVKDGNVFRHKITKVWQCNKNESIVKMIANTVDGAEVVFMPYAYIKE